MSVYGTRAASAKRAPPQSQQQPVVVAAVDTNKCVVDAIESLRETTRLGFEMLAESHKGLLEVLSQTRDELKRTNKRLDRAVECMTSMDESLLDLAVDKELDSKNNKKQRPEAPKANAAVATFQYPVPPETLSNNTALFFTATDPLRPPVRPPQ